MGRDSSRVPPHVRPRALAVVLSATRGAGVARTTSLIVARTRNDGAWTSEDAEGDAMDACSFVFVRGRRGGARGDAWGGGARVDREEGERP